MCPLFFPLTPSSTPLLHTPGFYHPIVHVHELCFVFTTDLCIETFHNFIAKWNLVICKKICLLFRAIKFFSQRSPSLQPRGQIRMLLPFPRAFSPSWLPSQHFQLPSSIEIDMCVENSGPPISDTELLRASSSPMWGHAKSLTKCCHQFLSSCWQTSLKNQIVF